MLFDDIYKVYMEELDISYSQLFKYPAYRARVSDQGPSQKGNTMDGFRGDTNSSGSTDIDANLFPQAQNKPLKEIKKDAKKSVYKKRERELLNRMKRIKDKS